MRPRPIAALTSAALIVLAAGACACEGTDPSGSATLRVVAGFYPLQYVAEHVGGDRVSVTSLAHPGAEAHDLELTPRQVAAIAAADLVIYLDEFQPALTAAVDQYAGEAGFDVATVVSLRDTGDHHTGDHHTGDHRAGDGTGGDDSDPHVWLDPTQLAAIADKLATRLGVLDPDRAEPDRAEPDRAEPDRAEPDQPVSDGGYAARADDLRARLEALDAEFADGLARCAHREIVVSHAAFGYLAERYDLVQITIAGLSPEDEPTPAQLAEVIAAARQQDATTIFFEPLVNPRIAEVIADEAGLATAVLDPIEGLTPGSTSDYLSIMRENLTALRSALGCP